MDKIKEIKEALEKATPGPWFAVKVDSDSYSISNKPGYYGHSITGWGRVLQTKEDAHLIANAPEWIAYLIGEVEKSQVDKSKMYGFFMQKMWKILCAEVGNEKADEILEKFIEEGGMDYDLSRSSP